MSCYYIFSSDTDLRRICQRVISLCVATLHYMLHIRGRRPQAARKPEAAAPPHRNGDFSFCPAAILSESEGSTHELRKGGCFAAAQHGKGGSCYGREWQWSLKKSDHPTSVSSGVATVCHRDGRRSYDCNMRKDSRLPSFASLRASSAMLLGMTTVDGTKFSKSKAAGIRQPLH